ncbi:hypothetical protein LRC484719_53060 [Mycobacterium riyadhense]
MRHIVAHPADLIEPYRVTRFRRPKATRPGQASPTFQHGGKELSFVVVSA